MGNKAGDLINQKAIDPFTKFIDQKFGGVASTAAE